MKQRFYSDFVWGKWYIHYTLWKPEVGNKRLFIPLFFHAGYGQLANSVMKGIWLSVCLFNHSVDEAEGGKLPGLHVIIPIKKL